MGCENVNTFRQSFQQYGYVVVPKLFGEDICCQAIQQAERLKQTSGFNNVRQKSSKVDGTHQTSNFPVENNRVSYFFTNTKDANQMNPQSNVKVGHFLHTNKVFKGITYNSDTKRLNTALGIDNPVIVQSMTLQKLPKKGSQISVHQDSTYLFAEPDTLITWWVPLVDVDQDNGCIWVIPGSHKKKLYQRFKIIHGIPSYDYDGPIDYQEKDFIPIKMNKGDCLILKGKLVHKSNDNKTQKSRNIYSWSVMDKKSK